MIADLEIRAATLLREALSNPQATFRDGQLEAISALVVNKAHLLVVRRTGWGKSLVYFLATRLLRDQGKGPTLLISPLLSLMRNQIQAAQRIGVEAVTINSSNQNEWPDIQEKIIQGKFDILLVSPERLANDDFIEQVLMPIADSIGLFVVDEAHCISDWGHDFRPDYRRITRILQALPRNIPVLATTATANDRVVKDVQSQLGRNLQLSRGPLARTSLRLQNLTIPDQATRMAWLAQYLDTLPGSGIIYTLTIRDCQRVAKWLQSEGFKVSAYSSESDSRDVLEQQLLDNEVKALVATSALGMGFDKPDLGFVIHFQRPGSAIHYYQQVGRAGRAIKEAYGILMGGNEDDDITDYFIQTAFPPEAHCQSIVSVLKKADGGLSLGNIESSLNLTQSQIKKVLKILSLENPAPVVRRNKKWYATPVDYIRNTAKIQQLIDIRLKEQERMQQYLVNQKCLMSFLQEELDDPSSKPCGRCFNCNGKPLLPVRVSDEIVQRAIKFLRRNYQTIEPRKQWPAGALIHNEWQGYIDIHLRMQPGRALCLWGDGGWGKLVRLRKSSKGKFDDALVDAVGEMIGDWKPEPFPTWVTCIPSLNNRDLVSDYSKRLAKALGLPFRPCIEKIKATRPQKEMQNSFHQAYNLNNAFTINERSMIREPVFLIDDMVDSRWTFTIAAAILQKAGSGFVFPVALSKATSKE